MARLSLTPYQTWWIVTIHSETSNDEVMIIITWLLQRDYGDNLMRFVRDSQLDLHVWLASYEDAVEIMLSWS
jgi:hypothetical protein